MKTLNKLINLAYCLGAAVVILGAWAKILHKPGANVILTIGLLTEATLFVFMGIQEWTSKEKETVVTGTDWTLDTHQQANARMYDREIADGVKETNSILRNVFKVD